ncbi:phosphatidylserine decarboxylase proenzyme, mitochondrial [Plakobranchus ocellatus]|uniref:Phosphatidylserine decarboxylase proenzyme, mitochondrial n=1 Tax=Plakobranchus ocellatus TaxID=259542 RepID=A0AAV4APZ5_9GAST|nr:phosphatidylserine decarboxylase proenzyme, mitochondrial [Plakobranchus ocellatus]
MVTSTLSAFAYENLELNQKMLWGALLVAVIVGSMRTTRHATLQLLRITAGELWGNMWTYSPHRYLAAALHKALPLPPSVVRKVRAGIKSAGRVMLGRYTMAKSSSCSARKGSRQSHKQKAVGHSVHHYHSHHHHHHHNLHHHFHPQRHQGRRINSTTGLVKAVWPVEAQPLEKTWVEISRPSDHVS